jgi:kynureninase
MTLTLQDCRALDAQDPLRELRGLFTLPEGVIYLDGNSLGVLPKAAPARVAKAVEEEWGQGLIRSWNSAGWFDMPQRLGDKIATLVGANPGEVVATDSTSINLFKVLSAALSIASRGNANRNTVISERSNFPTDLYIAESLCAQHGLKLKLVNSAGEIESALAADTAVLMLTHVNYRTGEMLDMAALTRAAHAVGALTVWDLAHSAGAVPVHLHAAQADFAIGCGYKYLNGGPGAPAFVWVHPRHADAFTQPLSGWWGHAAPFEFTPGYRPAAGIARYLCGTQPILSMTALDCGLDTLLAAQPQGGMAALRKKSLALTDLFISLVEERCGGQGLALVTPREHARRGSQVFLSREEGAYAIVQALIARGVIGDFRAGDGAAATGRKAGGLPDILRFGFTPLYIGFEDVWNAVEHLREVMHGEEWRRPEFKRKHAVT